MKIVLKLCKVLCEFCKVRKVISKGKPQLKSNPMISAKSFYSSR